MRHCVWCDAFDEVFEDFACANFHKLADTIIDQILYGADPAHR